MWRFIEIAPGATRNARVVVKGLFAARSSCIAGMNREKEESKDFTFEASAFS